MLLLCLWLLRGGRHCDGFSARFFASRFLEREGSVRKLYYILVREGMLMFGAC